MFEMEASFHNNPLFGIYRAASGVPSQNFLRAGLRRYLSAWKGEEMTDYLICPLRKDHGKVAVAVCHKKKCIFLASKDGKFVCDYASTSGGKKK